MSARTAMRLAAVALAGGMAVPVLAGCYVDVGALQHRTKSYAVSGPVQALVVNAHVGGVHVTGGAAGTVLVTEHLRFRHTAPVTTHGTSARTLTMNSTCPARETCSISYDITVPRATDLRITDSVGTIRLRSLSGKVIAHTDVGNIDLSSVSGPIELTGHAGSILGRTVSSPRATLRASAGRIDVTFSVPPATVSATATAGTVALRVPGNVPYAVHASTTVGSVRIGVTRSAASPRAITARVTTGSVIIEPAP